MIIIQISNCKRRAPRLNMKEMTTIQCNPTVSLQTSRYSRLNQKSPSCWHGRTGHSLPSLCNSRLLPPPRFIPGQLSRTTAHCLLSSNPYPGRSAHLERHGTLAPLSQSSEVFVSLPAEVLSPLLLMLLVFRPLPVVSLGLTMPPRREQGPAAISILLETKALHLINRARLNPFPSRPGSVRPAPLGCFRASASVISQTLRSRP